MEALELQDHKKSLQEPSQVELGLPRLSFYEDDGNLIDGKTTEVGLVEQFLNN